MTLKKAFSAAALGLSLTLAVSAQASTITNIDGTQNWTGFDWDANGTAFTTGFTPVTGDTFKIDAFFWAIGLKDGATNLYTPHLDNNANGIAAAPGTYEYTLHVQLYETATSCAPLGAACTFAISSGSYDVYYDETPDADARAGKLGVGYLDGTKLLSGNIFAGYGGNFQLTTNGGSGSASILGENNFTNLLYINPLQDSTTATTTLQIGSANTNAWKNPGGFNGVAFGAAPPEGTVVFQADANQSFSEVPEPVSLALFGIAMLGGGFVSRRRVLKLK